MPNLVHKLTDYPDVKYSKNADSYAVEWFRTHGRVVPSFPGDTPLVYFQTVETDVTTSLHGKNEPESAVTPVQADIGVLRLKGTVQGTNIAIEAGLQPTPAVYYKLGDLVGDLNSGHITQTFDDNLFYKGSITIQKGETDTKGIFDVLGKVDWLGLGMNVVGQVLPLLGSII
ncbi:hypothetical protein C8J56DRAFT_1029942 [Mycena floridula]|nr:hypothetical protein C8J56DRAFT_1169245 [Mycena floridula]KAJ7580441.1 hypothetical protein C8J56DRAFT_1029942 [Mycena floridula]